MKASLSTAHYAALMMPYKKLASAIKPVRRDEVARLYGVSGSVKNIFPNIIKNNLCLTIKVVLQDVM